MIGSIVQLIHSFAFNISEKARSAVANQADLGPTTFFAMSPYISLFKYLFCGHPDSSRVPLPVMKYKCEVKQKDG